MIVIMPMAGRGSRFKNEGYKTPKPFIQVANKPMFIWSIESLFKSIPHTEIEQLILIVLKEDADKNQLTKILTAYNIKATLIAIDGVTEGQLCTVLAAEKHLASTSSLLIIPSDTIVIHDRFNLSNNLSDGIISVSQQEGEQWSFAKFTEDLVVTEVAEKTRISDYASTGWYYFNSATTFLTYARLIIDNQEKTKGEYYVMPVYQKYLDNKLNVKAQIADQMYDLGTPASKESFEKVYNPNP